MPWGNWALVVVDLQRYYLEPQANFVRYFEAVHPGASEYIRERCLHMVVPRLQEVVRTTRAQNRPILYLRLCGQQSDRSDLHRHFLKSHQKALDLGYPDLYPLASDPLADVVPEVAPQPGDLVLCKTTYSGFTSSDLEKQLRQSGIDCLVMAGLATSQCVETTARDASDRGFRVVHLEDCQADYHDVSHRASLFSSQSVCGGHILNSDDFCQKFS